MVVVKGGNSLVISPDFKSMYLERGWTEQIVVKQEKVEIPIEESVKDVEESNSFDYKKSDIQRMPIDDLKRLATDLGIENAEDKKGADLKVEIIEKLEL